MKLVKVLAIGLGSGLLAIVIGSFTPQSASGIVGTNVTVLNTPLPVQGGVSVNNLPAVQPVSGSLAVNNFPSVLSGPTVPVSGSVSVANPQIPVEVDFCYDTGVFGCGLSGAVTDFTVPSSVTSANGLIINSPMLVIE